MWIVVAVVVAVVVVVIVVVVVVEVVNMTHLGALSFAVWCLSSSSSTITTMVEEMLRKLEGTPHKIWPAEETVEP